MKKTFLNNNIQKNLHYKCLKNTICSLKTGRCHQLRPNNNNTSRRQQQQLNDANNQQNKRNSLSLPSLLISSISSPSSVVSSSDPEAITNNIWTNNYYHTNNNNNHNHNHNHYQYNYSNVSQAANQSHTSRLQPINGSIGGNDDINNKNNFINQIVLHTTAAAQQHPQQQQQLISSSTSLSLTTTTNNTTTPTTTTPVYQMVSKPRGFCIIINNVDFDDNKYPRRVGSDHECQRLSAIFTKLYFEVRIKQNQRHRELLATMRLVAKDNDLSRHDCLVVIILSHGNSGQMIAADNQPIQFETVLQIFNNQNCIQLIKKPKMFFFNCCRGSTLDFGPQFTAISNAQINGYNNNSGGGGSGGGVGVGDDDYSGSGGGDDKDTPDAIQWPQVPIVSDMMVCYSTIDGYVSWRNEHQGTWFGSALAMALEDKADSAELNQILTIASEIVHNRSTRNGAKQAIEWKYRAWTKALYFNP
ncbi:caspase-7-like, partial [Oppia nitens]|uniref:caspase-7-like n=1 Tax=Oppia nitens TaxID=1686743 RepID=UPI0023DBABBF